MSIAAAIAFRRFGHEPLEAERACLEALKEAGVRLYSANDQNEAPRVEEAASSVWALVTDDSQLRDAQAKGLMTCAVLPEGVAEARGLLARANVIAHGWGEVSFGLLDDYAQDGGEAGGRAICRALVVAGSPEPSSPELVGRLAADADYAIACDAGADVCRAAGVVPDAFVGDGDSADSATLAWIRACAARRITFPPEKYATDLALAIDAARHEASRRKGRLALTLTCAAGGRADHALGVIGQLLAAADASPRLVEDGFELRVLSTVGTSLWKLPPDAEGATLSVIALSEGCVVSERGMRWNLDRRRLQTLGDEGISNIVASPCAEVECHGGACAVYLHRV